MTNTIAKEVAQDEIERWANAMDIDLEYDDLNEEEAEELAKCKNTLIKAIMRGVALVNDNGNVELLKEDGSTITFYEPTGAVLMASDNYKQGKDIAKMHGILAAMTRTEAKTFATMPYSRHKIAVAVFKLFLAS